MQAREPIPVVLAANANYFDGLAVTVLSLLYSNRKNALRIHLIDGGLLPAQKRFLESRIADALPGNSLVYFQIDPSVFKGYRTDYGNSYMTYARILVASLVPLEKIIYLDCDLLVATDIRTLWEQDLGATLAAAAQDTGVMLLKNDYPFENDCGDAKYFNAGVMVMNLREWRRQNIQDRLMELIRTSPQKFKWWDQTAMNALFLGNVSFVNGRWNRMADEGTLICGGEGEIFHYVGANKPWSKYIFSRDFTLWRVFYGRHVRSRLHLLRRPSYRSSYLKEWRFRTTAPIPLIGRLKKRRRLAQTALAQASMRAGFDSAAYARLHWNA